MTTSMYINWVGIAQLWIAFVRCMAFLLLRTQVRGHQRERSHHTNIFSIELFRISDSLIFFCFYDIHSFRAHGTNVHYVPWWHTIIGLHSVGSQKCTSFPFGFVVFFSVQLTHTSWSRYEADVLSNHIWRSSRSDCRDVGIEWEYTHDYMQRGIRLRKDPDVNSISSAKYWINRILETTGIYSTQQEKTEQRKCCLVNAEKRNARMLAIIEQ